jgi:hypothetical protein
MNSIFNETIDAAFNAAYDGTNNTNWCINELEDEKYNINKRFTSKNITQILAHWNDLHLQESGADVGNGCNIDLFGKLDNDLYFYLTAWCDYTGWDCQSGGSITVSNHKENLIAFAMDNETRERLKFKL